MRRKTMPENMRVHVTLDPGTTSGIRAELPDALAVHRVLRTLLRPKQPILRFAPAPIDAQALEQGRREAHLAGVCPFPLRIGITRRSSWQRIPVAYRVAIIVPCFRFRV